MRLTKKNFILLFLTGGYTLHFVTKFVLDHPAEAVWPTPNQAPWQSYVSTILAPIKFILIGPITWLQQDPDPPPPLRMILLGIYWTLLALGIHSMLARKTNAS